MDRLYALSRPHAHGALYIEKGFPTSAEKIEKKNKEEIMILLEAKKYMNYPRQRASNGNPQKYKRTRQKTWSLTR